MLLALFYIIHVVISLFLIGVVLLQQGKGADLSVFGGGSTMTAFGSRSATNILHKVTVVSFIAFIVTTLTIGVLQRGSNGSTIMEDVADAEVPAETADTPTPAADGVSGDAGAPASDDEATGDGTSTGAAAIEGEDAATGDATSDGGTEG